MVGSRYPQVVVMNLPYISALPSPVLVLFISLVVGFFLAALDSHFCSLAPSTKMRFFFFVVLWLSPFGFTWIIWPPWTPRLEKRQCGLARSGSHANLWSWDRVALKRGMETSQTKTVHFQYYKFTFTNKRIGFFENILASFCFVLLS